MEIKGVGIISSRRFVTKGINIRNVVTDNLKSLGERLEGRHPILQR